MVSHTPDNASSASVATSTASSVLEKRQREAHQTYFKVGLLTFVSIALITGVVFWLKGQSFFQGDKVTLPFKDVDGLREGASVQMMGIKVGEVLSLLPKVDPKTGKPLVDVTFAFKDATIHPPKASVVSVEQSGLIGDKYLEVAPSVWQPYSFLLAHRPPVLGQHYPAWVSVAQQQAPLRYGEVNVLTCQAVNQRHRCWLELRASTPGILLPKRFSLSFQSATGRFLIRPLKPELPVAYEPRSAWYTVKDPFRMSDFMALQVEVAESLRDVNLRINTLLSDATISDLQATATEVKRLTQDSRHLVVELRKTLGFVTTDLHALTQDGQTLLKELQQLTLTFQEIATSDTVQKDLPETIAQLKVLSKTLSSTVNAPEFQKMMTDLQVTMTNAKALSEMANAFAQNPEVRTRAMKLVNETDQALAQLQTILETVNTTVGSDPQALKSIVNDTKTTTQNLRRLTDRLKGRFLLFKLLF
jgi:phospholipid/cholesterol/gamma-HCH transport system substrate-binding protein